MPSSMVLKFTDADHYAASIRASIAEVCLIGCGEFAATLTRIDLHDLWLQRFSDSLPRIIHAGAPKPGRAAVIFRNKPGPSLRWNKLEMGLANIIHFGNDYDAFQASTGAANFASITLECDKLATYGALLAGHDSVPPGSGLSLTPHPSAMARLQRLHTAVSDLAETAPETIAHPEAARGLEQALIPAMVACLSTAEPTDNFTSQRSHEKIMRRFHAAVADHDDTAVYVTDVCGAVGIPERTLRLCCQESLGMGPKQYLMLRRMNLARQSLRDADRSTATVTGVAAGFGFWNFGRFAVEYKALFGESPSATLRTPRR